MLAHRFDVFGRIIIVEPTGDGWQAFLAGTDGKRRRADFEIPAFVTEDELCGFLADLLHEWATPAHPEARRCDP